MLNCLFFRIFSSVSFVSLYQTKAQRSGFCLELRSKGAERGMPSPARRYTRSGLCDEVVGVGFCPQTAFGREPVRRRLAKCDAGSFVGTSSISFASAQSAKAHPFRCASSQNRNRVAGLRFCVFCARWRSVGFFGCAAHTPAAGAQSRTQRRHAPHGTVQALDLLAGSIGPIFPTVGRSALSALRSEISRLPLLR